jgi:hypothetical protein
MSNPINPSTGAPTPRPTSAEPRPKATSSDAKFTVPSDAAGGDSVETRAGLSFGSLAPLVKTDLNNDAALATAQQVEKALTQEPLPLVNNRPQVISNLYETLLKEQQG